MENALWRSGFLLGLLLGVAIVAHCSIIPLSDLDSLDSIAVGSPEDIVIPVLVYEIASAQFYGDITANPEGTEVGYDYGAEGMVWTLPNAPWRIPQIPQLYLPVLVETPEPKPVSVVGALLLALLAMLGVGKRRIDR